MSQVHFIVHLPYSADYLMYYLACRYHLPDPESNDAKAEVIKAGLAVLIGFKEIRKAGQSVRIIGKDDSIIGEFPVNLRRLVIEKKDETMALRLTVGAEAAAAIYDIAKSFRLVNPEGDDDKDKAILLALHVLEQWDSEIRHGHKVCAVDRNNKIVNKLELPISSLGDD